MKTANTELTNTGLTNTGLASPRWLAEHLGDPLVRVIEVDVSPAAFDDGHIDGAVLWNVYADLKDADYRTAGPAALQRLVTSAGIGPRTTVVFYGYAPALGVWLPRMWGSLWCGHWWVRSGCLGRCGCAGSGTGGGV